MAQDSNDGGAVSLTKPPRASLLGIPPELRLLIYDHVAEDIKNRESTNEHLGNLDGRYHRVIYIHDEIMSVACERILSDSCRNHPVDSHPLAALLNTCATIYRESASLLYATTSFYLSFEDRSQLGQNLGDGIRTLRGKYRPRVRELHDRSFLGRIQHVSNIDIAVYGFQPRVNVDSYARQLENVIETLPLGGRMDVGEIYFDLERFAVEGSADAIVESLLKLECRPSSERQHVRIWGVIGMVSPGMVERFAEKFEGVKKSEDGWRLVVNGGK